MVNVPHFDYPFRWGADGHAIVVEQNSEKDVMNGVTAAAKTERGTRYFVPNFGIDDPTFKLMPLDLPTMEAQIRESEPRADIVSEQKIQDLIDTVTIGAGPIGE